MWWYSTIQKVVKHKNSNCDKIKKKPSNLEKTQIIKLWSNSRTQMVMKIKNPNPDKTQKLRLWQTSNTQISREIVCVAVVNGGLPSFFLLCTTLFVE